MRRRSSASTAVFESIESRVLLSVTPKWVEVPISSAAKSADSTLSNYKTYDLQVTVGSGDDWASADLKATLSSGRFYVPSSFNSNTEQKAIWSVKPNIQFDTFISAPNFTSPISLGRSTYPTQQSGSSVFTSNTVDVAWGDLSNTGSGTFTIARLTIQNGSTGSIRGRVGGTSGDVRTFSVGVPPTSSSGSPTGSISGTVWKDSDGDRVKDSSEVGISGVKIYLDSNNNSHLDSGETTTTTSSSGFYKFTGLSAGTYKIRQVLPSGYVQTQPTNNFGNNATLSTNSSSSSGENFGDKPTSTSGATGSISGTVWKDSDGDRVKDSTEVGISGVTIYLDSNNNSHLDSGEKTTTTSSSGFYKFTGLSAGTYKIRQVLPSGYVQTLPTNNYGNNATLSTNSSSSSGENFGDKPTTSSAPPTGRISGQVFHDFNRNGIKDGSDTGLSGWRVYIDRDNDSHFDAGEQYFFTDKNGYYKLTGLKAGTYKVRVVRVSSSWVQTTPANNFGHTVRLSTSSSSVGSENFGFDR